MALLQNGARADIAYKEGEEVSPVEWCRLNDRGFMIKYLENAIAFQRLNDKAVECLEPDIALQQTSFQGHAGGLELADQGGPAVVDPQESSERAIVPQQASAQGHKRASELPDERGGKKPNTADAPGSIEGSPSSAPSSPSPLHLRDRGKRAHGA